MNKPLLIAAVFVVAAMGFLVYSWVGHADITARAAEHRTDWEKTAQQRQQYTKLKQELKQLDVVAPPRGKLDLTAVMGELRDAAGIDAKQMEVRGERVMFTGIGLKTAGALFHLLRTKHGYLTVREIRMQPTPKGEPGQFNWTLLISTPDK